MKEVKCFLLVLLLCGLVINGFSQIPAAGGKVITENLASVILRDNKVGLNPNRQVKIYLPPGYAKSGKSYPVVYYLSNLFWSPEKMFEDGRIVKLSERGFASGLVKEFIIVAADYSTQAAGSIYENSPVSGRWLDFTVNELVPFVDKKFRTIRSRDSRAIVGDFMGGRGALKMALFIRKYSVSYMQCIR
jgi:enterochelin esterase-like enzyme